MFDWFQIGLLAYFLLECWLPSGDLKYLCSLPLFALTLLKTKRASWQDIVTFAFPNFAFPFPSAMASMSSALFCLLDSFFLLSFSFNTENGEPLLPLTFGLTCICINVLFLLRKYN